VDELSAKDGDGESFCMAITEISELHGKALDDCMRRVTGAPGVGCFDKSGKRDTQDCSKLVYILGQIGKVLELTVIEHRLTQLEDRSRG
jgi:hypothetical protein